MVKYKGLEGQTDFNSLHILQIQPEFCLNLCPENYILWFANSVCSHFYNTHFKIIIYAWNVILFRYALELEKTNLLTIWTTLTLLPLSHVDVKDLLYIPIKSLK